jgi:hypothetical protein
VVVSRYFWNNGIQNTYNTISLYNTQSCLLFFLSFLW